jgi:hypothetical protein
VIEHLKYKMVFLSELGLDVNEKENQLYRRLKCTNSYVKVRPFPNKEKRLILMKPYSREKWGYIKCL